MARGCRYDAETDTFLTSGASLHTPPTLDDGMLLKTLTECVGQLERQPLSVNMNKEVEKAKQALADQKAENSMELL